MGAKMVPTTAGMSFAQLEEMLRSRICKVCIERTAKGKCGLTHEEDCALFLHSPKMVRANSLVDSDRMVDYVDSIRKHVCSECPGAFQKFPSGHFPREFRTILASAHFLAGYLGMRFDGDPSIFSTVSLPPQFLAGQGDS